jgi:Tfp pilus assembly protein PilO
MLEKLKAFGEGAKNVVLFIVGPVIGILAYFFYLKGKNTELEAQVRQTQAERDLAGTLAKKEDATNEANKAEDDYHRTRSAYLNASGFGGDEEGPDDDDGPRAA